MKVLCVSTEKNNQFFPPPYDLVMMAKSTIDRGNMVEMLDFMWERNPMEKLQKTLESFVPEITVFHIRTLDNHSFDHPLSHLESIKSFVEIAKSKSQTILCGPGFSISPLALMKKMGSDFGFEGLPSEDFGAFLREIERMRIDFETPGAMWKKDDKIQHNPGRYSHFYQNGKISWDLIRRGMYVRTQAPWLVLTKTGYPFKSIFSNPQLIYGESFYQRDPEAVIDELEDNQLEYKMSKGVYTFLDPVFNHPLESSKNLLEKIIKSDLKLGFIAQLEPSEYDRDFIQLLVKAGCLMIQSHLISASNKILETNLKPYSQDNIRELMDLCDEVNLAFVPNLIFGLPGENQESVNETLSFFMQYKLTFIKTLCGVRLYPNTVLSDIAKNQGIIKPDTNLLLPQFYWTPGLSRESVQKQLEIFHKKRKASYKKWIRLLWKTNMLGTRN